MDFAVMNGFATIRKSNLDKASWKNWGTKDYVPIPDFLVGSGVGGVNTGVNGGAAPIADPLANASMTASFTLGSSSSSSTRRSVGKSLGRSHGGSTRNLHIRIKEFGCVEFDEELEPKDGRSSRRSGDRSFDGFDRFEDGSVCSTDRFDRSSHLRSSDRRFDRSVDPIAELCCGTVNRSSDSTDSSQGSGRRSSKSPSPRHSSSKSPSPRQGSFRLRSCPSPSPQLTPSQPLPQSLPQILQQQPHQYVQQNGRVYYQSKNAPSNHWMHKRSLSFDDSSSISSGISDTIAEISTDDPETNDSLGSDRTNPCGSLKRGAGRAAAAAAGAGGAPPRDGDSVEKRQNRENEQKASRRKKMSSSTSTVVAAADVNANRGGGGKDAKLKEQQKSIERKDMEARRNEQTSSPKHPPATPPRSSSIASPRHGAASPVYGLRRPSGVGTVPGAHPGANKIGVASKGGVAGKPASKIDKIDHLIANSAAEILAQGQQQQRSGSMPRSCGASSPANKIATSSNYAHIGPVGTYQNSLERCGRSPGAISSPLVTSASLHSPSGSERCASPISVMSDDSGRSASMLSRRKNGAGSHYMDSASLKERIYARTTPSPGAPPGDGTYARVHIGHDGVSRTSPYSTVTIQGGAGPTSGATPQFFRGGGAGCSGGVGGAGYAEGNQRLSDAESVDSVASSIHEKIQQARANSIHYAKVSGVGGAPSSPYRAPLVIEADGSSPRLPSRSNSIRSNSSERSSGISSGPYASTASLRGLGDSFASQMRGYESAGEEMLLSSSANRMTTSAHSLLSSPPSHPTSPTPSVDTSLSHPPVHHPCPTAPLHQPPSTAPVNGRFNFNGSPHSAGSLVRSSSQASSTHSGPRPVSAKSLLPGILAEHDSESVEDFRGSALSLASNASSSYLSREEKQQYEIVKLRRELDSAQEKVLTLTSQLSTNAHVVAAFEQSLSSMTTRLQALTHSTERKDSELTALHSTIEALRSHSSAIKANAIATGALQPDSFASGDFPTVAPPPVNQTPSSGRKNSSGYVTTGGFSVSQPTSPLLGGDHQNHHHNSANPHASHSTHGTPSHGPSGLHPHHPSVAPRGLSRQMSTESMSSLNSMSSACSVTSQHSTDTDSNVGKAGSNAGLSAKEKKEKKKKGWLRSSFTKAFTRKSKGSQGSSISSPAKTQNYVQSDVEGEIVISPTATTTATTTTATTALNLPPPTVTSPNATSGQNMRASQSSNELFDSLNGLAPGETPEVAVIELKKQLREKDMKLTDIRLEALTSAHQLDQMRETLMKMKDEMVNLKQDNERLQRLVTNKPLADSQSSLPSNSQRSSAGSLDSSSAANWDTLSAALETSRHSTCSLDLLLSDLGGGDGRRVTVSVYLGNPTEMSKAGNPAEGSPPEITIGCMSVSGKTKWDLLDNIVKRLFKEYVIRIDPVTNLGLNGDSVHSYHIGEITRSKDSEVPELLPCGYLVGDNMHIKIFLRGAPQNSVDALAFETLTPRSILQRYISLLMEHRRIILCGPSGTGKTYLAQKLGEYLVQRSGRELREGSIVNFDVDNKSPNELKSFLQNIAEQCEVSSPTNQDLPQVVILDNLHHVTSLGDVFNGFLSCKYHKCPYLIGTMQASNSSTTNLQLHHNFRWVLCANHMEPVKGFLGRFLRRKLVEHEVSVRARDPDLARVIEWIPKVWQHLNKFLETHNSADVTIGPRLFLNCPIDVAGSRVWFTDLWNYSLVPYLLEAVREGLSLYGRRANWEDPASVICETYPWPAGSRGGSRPSSDGDGNSSSSLNSVSKADLQRLRPEDVGFEVSGAAPSSSTSSSTTTTIKSGADASGSAAPASSKSATAPEKKSGAGDAADTGTVEEGDPILNMLLRLQEAANYTGGAGGSGVGSANNNNSNNDSGTDSVSIDSNEVPRTDITEVM